MYTASSLIVAALAGLAQAQSVTPAGFTPSASSKLDVFFNSTMVMTPGQILSKAGKQVSLTIGSPHLTSCRNSKSTKDSSSGYNGQHERDLHVRHARSRCPARGRKHKASCPATCHEHRVQSHTTEDQWICHVSCIDRERTSSIHTTRPTSNRYHPASICPASISAACRLECSDI